MTLITKPADLAALCTRLADAEFIAVDTEFMRERTYWPRLCLVQVAGPDDAVAIDPLAGLDLAPLFDLFRAPHIVKVFHAARQDLEIFFQLMGSLPAPVFDTQVAAMVCGFGDQVSYETLASKLARAKVDKGSRFTDWSLRPLSPRQIEYALADVIHLRPVYQKLMQKLVSTGRGEWLGEEMAALTNPAAYTIDPLQAFRRLRSRSGNGRMLAVMRELAAWREREARARDIPRTWVLKDESLLEIAHHTPRTAEALGRTRGLARKFAESPQGADVLAAVERGLAVPMAELPAGDEKRLLPRGVAPVVDLLKVLLKMKCDDADVAHRLVASTEDLEAIAVDGAGADVPALTGWRRHLFGEDALKLRSGAVAIVVEGRKLVLVERPGTDGGEAAADIHGGR
ncbi:MAG: ribonuclease D [Rhodospirillales bacterium]